MKSEESGICFDCPEKANLNDSEAANEIKELIEGLARFSSSSNNENCSVEFVGTENFTSQLVSGHVYRFDAKLKSQCGSMEKVMLCKNFKIYEPFSFNCEKPKEAPCLEVMEQENITCDEST